VNYPIWEIPILGSGWMIGLIATCHVFISQFAVGGGLFLPMMERRAYETNDYAMMDWLKKHAKFFLILTSSVGAVFGVGIWLTIGLVHAQATASLIRIFVQFWAIEWVFFFTEVCALAFYYYSWGKISTETHLKIGWVYFGSAWGSLFIINGILSCMLTSGMLPDTGNPWDGFFNVMFWPMLILRTCVCFGLAGVYAFYTGAGIKDEDLKARVLKSSSVWILPSFFLIIPVGVWAFMMLPDSSQELLMGGMAGTASGTNSILTRMGMVMLMTSVTLSTAAYLGPYKNPRHFERWIAGGLIAVAFVGSLSTEWIREVVRKPYVIRDIMYSSGVRVDQVAKHNKEGHLANALWARTWFELGENTPERRGEAIFRSQCLPCHTREGYRPMKKLMAGRNQEAIFGFLTMISETNPEKNGYLRFMPPFVGTESERHDTSVYLAALVAEEGADHGHAKAAKAEEKTEPKAEEKAPADAEKPASSADGGPAAENAPPPTEEGTPPAAAPADAAPGAAAAPPAAAPPAAAPPAAAPPAAAPPAAAPPAAAPPAAAPPPAAPGP